MIINYKFDFWKISYTAPRLWHIYTFQWITILLGSWIVDKYAYAVEIWQFTKKQFIVIKIPFLHHTEASRYLDRSCLHVRRLSMSALGTTTWHSLLPEQCVSATPNTSTEQPTWSKGSSCTQEPSLRVPYRAVCITITSSDWHCGSKWVPWQYSVASPLATQVVWKGTFYIQTA